MLRLIMTFFAASIPGAFMGYFVYSIIVASGWVVLACSIAGLLIAIPIGMLCYIKLGEVSDGRAR